MDTDTTKDEHIFPSDVSVVDAIARHAHVTDLCKR